jgi:filamentous hemagglutinin
VVETGYERNLGGGQAYRHESAVEEAGAEIHGRGEILLAAGNDLNVRGAYIAGESAILLAAGQDINLTTAESGFDLENAVRNTGSNGLFSDGWQTKVWETHEEERRGTTVSGRTVELKAEGDATIRGSEVVAEGDVRIAAEGDIRIEGETATYREDYAEKEKKSGVFASGGSLTFGSQRTETEQDEQGAYNVGSLVGSLAGDVKIEAGGAYRQTGSVMSAAVGDIELAADAVVIEAAREDYVQDYRQVFKQSGLTIAVSAPVLDAVKTVEGAAKSAKRMGESRDGRVNALAAANAGLEAYRLYEGLGNLASAGAANAGQAATSGLTISITYGEQENEQTRHVEQRLAAPSQVLAGGEIRIEARGEAGEAGGGDLKIEGSDLAANGDITLFARDELNLLAAEQGYLEQNENKRSGWNAGVALSLGDGGWSLGITAGGNVGKGYADAEETTWRNSHVEGGGQVRLESGADTRLIGAQAKGEEIAIEARNLTIESLQDTAKFEAEQKDASVQVTVGYGFSASGSYGKSEIEADYRSVREQGGIYAGDGGYQITVRENADLTGALITSSEKAEEEGRNRLTTGTLTARDLENHSAYEAEGFNIGASGGFTGGGLGEGYAPQGGKGRNEDGTQKTGRDSVVAGSGMGYGRDSDEEASVTQSGINTRNITLTDEESQKFLTGKSATETIASLYTTTTTETAEANSGKLENNFDRERVQDEIALQIAVTQEFGANVQYAQGRFREQEKELRDQAKAAEAAGDFAQAAKLYGEAKGWQEGEVLLNMLAGGLTAPTDSAGGILASTLAPGISYGIGQYFKEQGTEGSAAHLLAHAILGGAVAAAGGNDALTGALAAGGAEAMAPLLSNYLYGKDASDLDPEQKETLSAIASLAGNAIGGMLGNSAADVIGGGQAARAAVENNYLFGHELNELIEKQRECGNGSDAACARVEELKNLDAARDFALNVACSSGDEKTCNELRLEANLAQGSLNSTKFDAWLDPEMWFDSEKRLAHKLEYADIDRALREADGWTPEQIAQEASRWKFTADIVKSLSAAGTVEDAINAKTWGDYVWLGLGIIPGVKGADNAVDALKGVEKAGDALKSSEKILGKDFGKLGTVVENQNINIDSLKKHYLDRKIERNISSSQVFDAINNPSVVLQQSGGKYLYLTEEAAVVISKNGELITTYGSNNFDDAIKEIFRQMK